MLKWILIFALWFQCFSESHGGTENQMVHVTNILNDILNMSHYNYQIMPFNTELGPFKVFINFHLKSMGPIVEDQQIYFMDLYFRQIWVDRRLRFQHSVFNSDLKVSPKVLRRIWRPDTVFYNGVGSKLHMITEPNRLFRVNGEGMILYSQRLTIKAICKMNFKFYPIDTQICPLYIASLSYTPEELEYVWDKITLMTKDDFALAQFTFNRFIIDEVNRTLKGELKPMLRIRFIVSRHLGFYMLQIYLPCYFIVVISWISFWINREASAARVTLGLTTMLTMTTIALNSREGIPKVSYCTAMDVFLFASYFFVFATIVEYAGVNHFTKTGTFDIIETSDSSEDDSAYQKRLAAHRRRRNNFWANFMNCLMGDRNLIKGRKSEARINSVSQIDLISRWVFPGAFVLFNLVYWLSLTFYAKNIDIS